MGRKRSEIVEKDGVLYRLTPYDPDAEAQREAWITKNYCTANTRIPLKTRQALDQYCAAHRTTVYAILRRYIVGLLEIDAS